MKRDQPELDKQLCGVCGSTERWFLHYVRHRGIYRKLCTNCVLKNNPGLFCPICLDFYEYPLPVRDQVMCIRCPSISHAACVAANSSFRNFQCPSCSQPTFSFFNLRRQNDCQEAKTTIMIDKDAAMALFAAARIAAAVMTEAAVVARGTAESRVNDAITAKKKAREALERLTSLVKMEREKDLKSGGIVSAPESLNVKPKLEGPGAIKVAPKISEPEGSNGLRGDQLKTSHADP
ncbi:uncharacterized protein Pyn_22387 [Prunus yedoensis var. nudiflora]|uniref:Uncharacterized protein n=1 Tax=Prunus yedoensis var. nudiflora TaxID=2094558 RepID=A0A314ULZ4_PRUYE|nr:uncharacterized protein Pyn_22387 [Prunus yedoensis var. nudiflora]